MSLLHNDCEDRLLNHITGYADWTIGSADLYIALFTDLPSESITYQVESTGMTGEATYTNYARVPIAGKFPEATTTSVQNSSVITFAQAGTGSSETLRYFVITDEGLGICVMWGALMTNPRRVFCDSVTDRIYQAGTVGHAQDQEVVLVSDVYPTGLPGGLYVSGTPTNNWFQIDDSTVYSSPFTWTGDGFAILGLSSPLVVTDGVTPQFGVNALTLVAT